MSELRDKNRRLAFAVTGIVLAMVALSFASVPLYRLFCQITGYDGTVSQSDTLPDHILERKMTISFDARVDSSLPWRFGPDEKHVTVKIGQKGFISYSAVNQSARRSTGVSVFNVTPDKAGKYFHKIQCFCFAEQSLDGGKTAHFPVVFYVDPAIAEDRLMDDVTDITLSYTFYAAESDALNDAMSNYGQAAP
jgi:cytochrome c oxidase assembly protein subunit 11